MADVRALRGIRYSASLVDDPAAVLAPPYDVIPETDLDQYRQRSPYNVVRLTRPGTDYAGAAALFNQWQADRALENDAPAMYLHEVAFDRPPQSSTNGGGSRLQRRGPVAPPPPRP